MLQSGSRYTPLTQGWWLSVLTHVCSYKLSYHQYVSVKSCILSKYTIYVFCICSIYIYIHMDTLVHICRHDYILCICLRYLFPPTTLSMCLCVDIFLVQCPEKKLRFVPGQQCPSPQQSQWLVRSSTSVCQQQQ